jgi:hydroxypyruvate reductase/glycerate 2-kinase
MKAKLASQDNLLKKIPEILLHDSDRVELDLDIAKDIDVWLVAVGKGSLRIAHSLATRYNDQLVEGLVISSERGFVSENIQVFEGSHPIPDSDTIAASYEVYDFVNKIPPGNTLVFCISGGASSMFTIPPFGIEIDEVERLHELLLRSGASIHEMNIVRKHVCDLKGGKFVNELHHLSLISIIESDVPGDDLSTIGSGPTIPDPSTFVEAVQILKNLNIWDEISLSIQEHLICGIEGYIPENPKPKFNEHPSHTIKVLDSISRINTSISKYLKKEGYIVWKSESSYSGTVQKVAKEICGKAVSILSGNEEIKKPAALIYNGESTVKIVGSGKGGRNQELALMAALSFEGQHAISMLSMDTDGIDGPTEAAGAIVNSNTTLKARKNGTDPEKLLSEHNSFEFHNKEKTLLMTGPTGLNLMDLQVVLID